MLQDQRNLIRLFEAATEHEVAPKLPPQSSGASAMGGGGFAVMLQEANPITQRDMQFAGAATAIWLYQNTVPLFTEIARAMNVQSNAGLSPLALTEKVVDYLKTGTQSVPVPEQTRYLADLMINAGVALNRSSHDWQTYLKTTVGARHPTSSGFDYKRLSVKIRAAVANTFRMLLARQSENPDLTSLIRWAV